MHYFRVLAILAALGTTPAYGDGSDKATPETSSAGYEAAEAAILAGNFAAALPILTELTRAEPRNADAWNLLGFAARKTGQMQLAASAYAQALAIDPDHLGALEYQGEMFLDLGQPEKARANFDRLQSLCGACEEAEDLGKALSDAGA